MRYLVSNSSSTKMYITKDQSGYNSVPIGPGETISLSEYGKDLLFSCYGTSGDLAVIGTTAAEDPAAPTRTTITTGSSWALTDFGTYYGYFELSVPTGAVAVNFSFSGFSSPATDPPASKIGVVNPGESIQIYCSMDPERYIFTKSASASTLYVVNS